MADILSVINGAAASVQKLYEVTQKMKDADTANLIADLKMTLADLKIDILSLQEENKNLHDKLILKDKMVFKAPYYYIDGDQVPHCSRCWESYTKAIHLMTRVNSVGGDYFWCPECSQAR